MSSWWLILLPLSPLPVGADKAVCRRRPWATYAILALNALVYLTTLPDHSVDGGDALFQRWGLVPGDFRAASLLTAPFFHVSLQHLFWNLLVLWVFGPLVEDALGPLTFTVLYLGGGAIAGLLDVAIVRLFAAHSDAFQALLTVPVVGASGAIAAILAPFVIRYHRSKIRLLWLPALAFGRQAEFQLPAVYAFAFLVLENIAGAIYGYARPLSGDIAYWAHLGGFAFGFAVAGMSGLFLDGAREYLLDDARAASAQGPAGYAVAVSKYQAYLELQPADLTVRLECIAALAGLSRANGNPTLARQAGADLQSLLRTALDAADLRRVVEIVALGRKLSLPLDIPARERLRIATAAQETGDRPTAVALLESLLADQASTPAPVSPVPSDDEIARLKLGQLLVDSDPARAAVVLDSLIQRYPESDWIRMARQLRAQLPSR